MTDGYWSVFTLRADDAIADGVQSGFPEIRITCSGRSWQDTVMHVPAIIESRFLVDAYVGTVTISVDGKQHEPLWEVDSSREAFFVDGFDYMHRGGGTKEILRSADFRVRFEAYPGRFLVTRFSPAGINREMLVKACGAKFAKVK
jgi:hypothetical protein